MKVSGNENFSFGSIGDGDFGQRQDSEQVMAGMRHGDSPKLAQISASDKIKLILKSYLDASGDNPQRSGLFHHNSQQQTPLGLSRLRLHTRAINRVSPSSLKEAELLEKWLDNPAESEVDAVLLDKLLARPRDSRQNVAGEASQPEQQSNINSASQSESIGHKTIRTIQPVIMRLPPRFGKRYRLR